MVKECRDVDREYYKGYYAKGGDNMFKNKRYDFVNECWELIGSDSLDINADMVDCALRDCIDDGYDNGFMTGLFTGLSIMSVSWISFEIANYLKAKKKEQKDI